MDNNNYKILVVDDEEDILKIIRYNLKQEGYTIETARDGGQALQKAYAFHPDLILLDIMMPIKNGRETLKELRKDPLFDHTHILFLTALSSEQAEIEGLNLGADDYITKPVTPRLLISRINAFLRRSAKKEDEEIIRIGDLVIDKAKYLIIYKGKEIILARKEFELLALMASTPGRVFSRQEIFNKIWGTEVIVGDRTIDVHIHKIRQKAGDFITTVKGVGYRFNI